MPNFANAILIAAQYDFWLVRAAAFDSVSNRRYFAREKFAALKKTALVQSTGNGYWC